MRSRRLLSVLVVVALLAVSACGGSDDSEGIKPIESRKPPASAAPSAPAPSPTPTALPTTTAEAAKLSVAVLATNAAETPEEQAVVDTWMTYWSAVFTTYSDLSPAPGLDVARGKPLTGVLDYLNELKTKGERSVGWTRVNVQDVKVDGNSAALRDCAENFSFTVDSADKPTEEVTPFYSIIGQLTKQDGGWILETLQVDGTDKDCRN